MGTFLVVQGSTFIISPQLG